MKILTYILQGLFFLIILGAGAIFFTPSIVGNVELKIVKSGSMEPSIMTGSVVLIVPKTQYAEGDVITFADENARIPTTHRIVKSYIENGQTLFVTKGDANEEEDMLHVPLSSVMGSVAISVPYVGYLIDFARQPVGFSLLIVMPAFLIILGELDKIRKEIWGRRRDGRSGEEEREVLATTLESEYIPQNTNTSQRTLDLRCFAQAVSVRHYAVHTLDLRGYMSAPVEEREPVQHHASFFPNWAIPLLFITVSLSFAGANFIPYTMSYFSDTERSLGNVFQAGMFEIVSTMSESEVFEFSVTPTNSCFTYTENTLNESTLYTPFPETVTSYDITIANVVGDFQLCSSIGVATGSMAPVLISEFGVFSLSSPTELTFSNLEVLKKGNRWCNADIVFSSVHEGVQYWATSTLQINDSSAHNSNTCLIAEDSTSNVTTQGDKKKPEINADTIPKEDAVVDEEVVEELPIPENETSEENEAVEDTLQDAPETEGENEEPDTSEGTGEESEEDTQTEEQVEELETVESTDENIEE